MLCLALPLFFDSCSVAGTTVLALDKCPGSTSAPRLLDDDCVELGLPSSIVCHSRNPVLSQGTGAMTTNSTDVHPLFDSDSLVSFKVTHTGLGNKKHVEKGALATFDIGIQIMPLLGVQQQPLGPCSKGQGQEDIYLLNMTTSAASHDACAAQLATWMSNPSVEFDALRAHWKVWKVLPPQPSEQSGSNKHVRGFAFDHINLQAYGISAEKEHACRDLIKDIIAARAFGDQHGGHCYVPTPDLEDGEDSLIKALQSSGVIVQSGLGFRWLSVIIINQKKLLFPWYVHPCAWFVDSRTVVL